MKDLGMSPTHCSPSFHTSAADQSASVILLLFSRVALPNVVPRSLMTSHGEVQVWLPSAASRLAPSAQSNSCCSGLESECWIKTARSFKASTCARVAPPAAWLTISSSGQAHPSKPGTSIGAPAISRSMAAGSNTRVLTLLGLPSDHCALLAANGSLGHARHVTREGYIPSALNPSAHSSRLPTTSEKTSALLSPYLTFNTFFGPELAPELRRVAAQRLVGKDIRARHCLVDDLLAGQWRTCHDVQRRRV